MTGLDVLLTILSVLCFAIAFVIASRPVAKTKLKHREWNIENEENKPTVEIFTTVSEETQ